MTFGPQIESDRNSYIVYSVPKIPLKFTENTVGYRIYVAHLNSQSLRNAIVRFAISPACKSVFLSPVMQKQATPNVRIFVKFHTGGFS